MTIERFILSPVAGVSTGIGFYLSGMDEVRAQLREVLAGMSAEQLARRAVEGAHPIGALALHCVSAEWLWMRRTADGSALTDEELRAAYMDVLEDPDGFAAKGYSAEDCVNALDAIRERTRERLASFSDDELDRLFSFERRV
jgi:uncharacterized damage-inducible protein DinB